MNTGRRVFIALAIAGSAATGVGLALAREAGPANRVEAKFGLITKLTTVEGKRDEFIAILDRATRAMPGCLSYVVAKDHADPSAVWVTEVWDDAASHKASASLPAVREAMAEGRRLIARSDLRVTTEPVGGHGLAPATPR